VILEPAQPHGPCGILFLQEHENFHSELLSLRYLARMRVIELQDWAAPSSSSDDDFPGALDDDDSGDSNYNGYHPGIDGSSRSRSFGPRTVRLRETSGAPSLRGSGLGSALTLPPWMCGFFVVRLRSARLLPVMFRRRWRR
jgi:hypothetical protein